MSRTLQLRIWLTIQRCPRGICDIFGLEWSGVDLIPCIVGAYQHHLRWRLIEALDVLLCPCFLFFDMLLLISL